MLMTFFSFPSIFSIVMILGSYFSSSFDVDGGPKAADFIMVFMEN